MQEVMIKTHLIVTDVHEEYFVDWCGRIADAKPLLVNGMPVFIIIGTGGRAELNTIDMKDDLKSYLLERIELGGNN